MPLPSWLRRLFRGPAVAPPPPPEPRPLDRSLASAGLSLPAPTLSAADVLEEVGNLRRRSAAWPEVLALLNPDGDEETQHLLEALRGPHLFAPHVALNVLEDGCRRHHEDHAERDEFLGAHTSALRLRTRDTESRRSAARPRSAARCGR